MSHVGFRLSEGSAVMRTLIAFVSLFALATNVHSADALPSWNDGATKKAIVDFVAKVTTKGGKEFVAPAERIATFDNDGTLWAEQPMYFQFLFALDRVKALAPQHPEWKDKEPFASLLKGDLKGALAGGEHALLRDRGRDALGHDDRGVRADRRRTGCAPRGTRSSSGPTPSGLPADARAAALPARQRLQDLHRLRRRRGVHARRGPSRPTASRPSRSSAARASRSSRCATASRCW